MCRNNLSNVSKSLIDELTCPLPSIEVRVFRTRNVPARRLKCSNDEEETV